TQVLSVQRAVKRLGTLVVICNTTESAAIGQREDLELIYATDDTWQQCAIDNIRNAHAIIIHIAPREGPGAQVKEHIDHSPLDRALGSDDILHIPVQEFGAGHGVLREL